MSPWDTWMAFLRHSNKGVNAKKKNRSKGRKSKVSRGAPTSTCMREEPYPWALPGGQLSKRGPSLPSQQGLRPQGLTSTSEVRGQSGRPCGLPLWGRSLQSR